MTYRTAPDDVPPSEPAASAPGQLPLGTPLVSSRLLPEPEPLPEPNPGPLPESVPGGEHDDAPTTELWIEDVVVAAPAPTPLPAPASAPEPRLPAKTISDDVIAARLRLLAAPLATAAVLTHFVLLRWTDTWWWDTVVVGALVAALAVAGARSVRHGAAAPYLAIALALPFALSAASTLAHDLRAPGATEVEGAAAAASGADPIDAAIAQAVPVGGTVSLYGFDVTLTSAVCGLATIPDGLPGRTHYSEGSKHQFADAWASDGQEFCVVVSDWANTTSAPLLAVRTGAISQVRTEDGTTYSATESDADVARVLNSPPVFGEVNPGVTLTHRSVVSVPAGSTITHALASGAGTGTGTGETATPGPVAFSLD